MIRFTVLGDGETIKNRGGENESVSYQGTSLLLLQINAAEIVYARESSLIRSIRSESVFRIIEWEEELSQLFHEEERLMIRSGYPDYAGQCFFHSCILRRLRIKGFSPEMRESLVRHEQTADMPFLYYLKRRNGTLAHPMAGFSPERMILSTKIMAP